MCRRSQKLICLSSTPRAAPRVRWVRPASTRLKYFRLCPSATLSSVSRKRGVGPAGEAVQEARPGHAVAREQLSVVTGVSGRVSFRTRPKTGELPANHGAMSMRTLLEKSPYADLLREIIGFAAKQVMDLQLVGLLTSTQERNAGYFRRPEIISANWDRSGCLSQPLFHSSSPKPLRLKQRRLERITVLN